MGGLLIVAISEVGKVVDLILSSTFTHARKPLTRSSFLSAERPDKWMPARLITRRLMNIPICGWWATPPCCQSVPRSEDQPRRVSPPPSFCRNRSVSLTCTHYSQLGRGRHYRRDSRPLPCQLPLQKFRDQGPCGPSPHHPHLICLRLPCKNRISPRHSKPA